MKEIEVKILDIDKTNLEHKLESLGAKKVYDGKLSTIYLDTKTKSVKTNNSVLRIRTNEIGAVLCYKKRIENKKLKTCNEFETNISDVKNTIEILKGLGYFIVEEIIKHRTTYKLKSVCFDIDTFLGSYSYIPTFFEIEAVNKKDILKYVKLLGFKETDAKPWGLNELIKRYS